MKTQPQLLLESIVPLPEWVHEEWHKEIAQKWDIIHAGDQVVAALRAMVDAPNSFTARAKAIVALEHWEKMNEPKQPVV